MQNRFKIDFLGIGAPRSGTTWIAECLKQHPRICLSSPKEVHFFGTNKYAFGLDWYQKHFSCQPGQIKGEFDPGCLVSEKAVSQIKQTFPQAKLIACLRNPINRAYSNYLSVFGFDPKIGSFEQTLEKNPESLERGLYAKHLKKYYSLFPKERILVLIYEDIKKDPIKFIQKIYRFLEVDENFIPSAANQKENPSQGYRCPIIKRWSGRIIKKLENSRRGIGLANLLKKAGGEKLFKLIQKINQKPISQKPKLNPETKKYLREYYQEDIKELEKLLNRDLSLWR